MNTAEQGCFEFKAVFEEVESGSQHRRNGNGETSGILGEKKNKKTRNKMGDDEKRKGNKTHRLSTGGFPEWFVSDKCSGCLWEYGSRVPGVLQFRRDDRRGKSSY